MYIQYAFIHIYLYQKTYTHMCVHIYVIYVYIIYIICNIYIYGIHHRRISRSSCRKLAWVIFELMTTEFCSYPLTNWAIRPWFQLWFRANFLQILHFHLIVQRLCFISAIAFNHHICFKWSLRQVITLVEEWIKTCGIHHWRIFRSYRKLAWVELEPMITEFCSGALTDRVRVQLTLRANFLQLLQFDLIVQSSHFIVVFAFISCHICFKWSLAQVIMVVVEWMDRYGIHHWKIFSSSYRSWPEWDLNPQSLNSIQTL